MPRKGWRDTSRPGWDGDIETQFPLIKFVYGRLPAHVQARLEFDDAFQTGVEALLAAKRLYDPARGSWSNYAYTKIRYWLLIAAGLTDRGWERRAEHLEEWRWEQQEAGA